MAGSANPTPSTETSDADDQQPTGRYSYMIALVQELHTPMTIDQLVDPMHQWECELGSGVEQKSWNDVHRELYLVDLPVLDRTGHLTFDVDSGIVDIDHGAE